MEGYGLRRHWQADQSQGFWEVNARCPLPLQGRSVSCGSVAVPSPWRMYCWEPPCTASSSWDCPRNTGKMAAGPTCSPSLRESRDALPSGKSWGTSTPPCCQLLFPMHSDWSSGNRHHSLGHPSSWAPWVGWVTLPTGTSRKNTSRARLGLGVGLAVSLCCVLPTSLSVTLCPMSTGQNFLPPLPSNSIVSVTTFHSLEVDIVNAVN